MYEELVKRLRYENMSVLQMCDLMDEAADAIEELSGLVNHYGGETGIKNLEEYAIKYGEIVKGELHDRYVGKWEVDEDGCGICSACGNYAFETTTHHISGWYPRFCPNCGAKMMAEPPKEEKI